MLIKISYERPSLILENEYDKIYIDADISGINISSCYGIYGIVSYQEREYLILIQNVRNVGEINGQAVYEIKSVCAVCLQSGYSQIFIDELEQFFRSTPGFYFSNYNLHEEYSSFGKIQKTYSRVFQKQEHMTSSDMLYSKNSHKPRPADRSTFIFNRHPLSKYIRRFGSNTFTHKVILGYFGKYKDYILISRRGDGRVGTRFFSRGVDVNGNASNFVETEQIIEHMSSFIELRGSIPLPWAQVPGLKYTPAIEIHSTQTPFPKSGNAALNNPKTTLSRTTPLENHVKLIQSLYDRSMKVIFLNLIQEKGNESELNRVYSNALQKGGYTFFSYDFHAKNKIEPIDFDFSTIHPSIYNNKQTIIPRTNCIDSLDRTNSMQFYAAREVLKKQTRTPELYDKQMRNLWVQNGSNISIQYSGTPALHSRNITGDTRESVVISRVRDASKSFKRYFINRYTDVLKNDIFRILTGETNCKIRRKRDYYHLSNRNIVILIMMLLGFSSGVFLNRKTNLMDFFRREKEILPDDEKMQDPSKNSNTGAKTIETTIDEPERNVRRQEIDNIPEIAYSNRVETNGRSETPNSTSEQSISSHVENIYINKEESDSESKITSPRTKAPILSNMNKTNDFTSIITQENKNEHIDTNGESPSVHHAAKIENEVVLEFSNILIGMLIGSMIMIKVLFYLYFG